MGRQVSEIQRKDVLISQLRSQRGGLQVTLIDKRADVKKSTTKHTRVMQTLEETQDILRSLQLRFDSARNVTRNKRSQYDNLTARLHAAKDKLGMRETKARHLRENISSLDADIIGCQRQAESLKHQLACKDDEFSSLQDAIAATDDTARVKLTEIAQHQLQYANYHNMLERDVINARDLGKQLEDTMEKGKKNPCSPKKKGKKHK
jgi:chromosome segregation ATPase